jgi:lipid-A-disaccharide synthase
MRRYLDHVLALLPFEPAFIAQRGGPPCTYVGHPLTQRIQLLRPGGGEAARRAADPPIVLALPGSRSGEVRGLAATFGAALALAHERAGPLEIVVPTVPQLLPVLQEETTKWPLRPRIVTEAAERLAAFRSARAALAKSGTVTLELALAGVPMVAAYRVSPVEAVIARAMISVDSVILANLVLGEKRVPELLQRQCVPEAIAAKLVPLLGDTPERREQLAAFSRLDDIMEIGKAAPSARAAEVVIDCARASHSR